MKSESELRQSEAYRLLASGAKITTTGYPDGSYFYYVDGKIVDFEGELETDLIDLVWIGIAHEWSTGTYTSDVTLSTLENSAGINLHDE